MSARWSLLAVLILGGAGWGLTQPLTKIVVMAGRQPLGMIVWQFAIGSVLLTALQALRRRPFRRDRPALGTYAVIALLGSILPNAASFVAYRHVPSGVMSILISTVPMMAFALALALRADRFSGARLAGLSLGLTGILFIVGPGGALGSGGRGTAMSAAAVLWVPLGLVAPALYACEANYVSSRGIAGLGPIQLLHGASVFGFALTLPLALTTGQFFAPDWPLAVADYALAAAAVINALCYALYVWIVGRAGATFGAQIAYLVTGFGVIWAMVILGERYSAWVWLALVLVLTGVFLVQPRRKPPLAATGPCSENAPS